MRFETVVVIVIALLTAFMLNVLRVGDIGECEDWSYDCPPKAPPAEPVAVTTPSYTG